MTLCTGWFDPRSAEVTVRWIAPLLTLFLCESLAAQEVQLSFAWPDTLVARVEAEGSRVRNSRDGGMDTVTWNGVYVLRAIRDGQSVHVSRTDVSYESPEYRLSSNPDIARAYRIMHQNETAAAAMEFMIAPYKVDLRTGTVEITNVEEHRAALEEVIEPMFEEEMTAQMWRPMLSTSFLEALYPYHAAREWSLLVGLWDGLPVGPQLAGRSDDRELVRVGMGRGAPEEMDVAVALSAPETASCSDRAGDEPACVRLRRSTEPDAEQYIEAMQRHSSGSVDLESWTVRGEVELVTEPSTLVPHRLTYSDVQEGDSQISFDGQIMDERRPILWKRVGTYVFRYE